MGGECLCSSWMCRPVWPLLLLLLVVTASVLHGSESPAPVGKIFPRGKHWAVGHLMGKKSIQSQDSDFLTSQEAAAVSELQPYRRLMEALMQRGNQKLTTPTAAETLANGWREEDRDKYLREMSDLVLLAMKQQDSN
ncbi:gastrin-releasing peptide [Aulostomus maculatus]